MRQAPKNGYTIAIDIDGVLFDFEEFFCERFGFDNRHMENLKMRYPKVPPSLIDEFVENPGTYENLSPIFGGMSCLLNQAKRMGFYVLLLTGRPKHLKDVTQASLDRYHASYHEIRYSQSKSLAIQEYNELFPFRPISLLIDDLAPNLVGLPVGVAGLAWEQPWNDGYFPRARYNHEMMRLEIKENANDTWKQFWKTED